MIEAKLTKGPWVIHPTSENERWLWIIGNDGADRACRVVLYPEMEEQSNADAHLISAAPDMYEALNGLHKTIMNAFPSLAGSEPMVSAIQALAKARGEQ